MGGPSSLKRDQKVLENCKLKSTAATDKDNCYHGDDALT